MIFKQFYHQSLGHASYFIGSERTGEALVLDVRRDVDVYLEEARRQGMRIRYATDTHQHNDYVSGICELPRRADVQLLAGARAQLGYPVRKLEDGEQLEMGELLFEVLQTPGHTPEHICLLVTDRDRGDAPALLLSGGSLLVDDVGRPDLLGDRHQVQDAARALCRTLQDRLMKLPDHLEVYPTHVAGSLCGGHIGSRLSTTIGYERRLNRLLAAMSREHTFLEQCLDLRELPAVPPYWRRMRQLNRAGAPPVGPLAEPPALQPSELDRRRQEGVLVLDCRSPEAFGGAHIPGALHVGLSSSFPTWAGTVLPSDRPYLLVLEHPDHLWQACWELLRIGFDLPRGWLAGGMSAWRTAALPLETTTLWTVQQLHRALEERRPIQVLDVRQPYEWTAGHIRGAKHITGAQLPERLEEVPRHPRTAVVCGSGYRASVAASLLEHHGYRDVINVLGGMTAWKRAGLEVE